MSDNDGSRISAIFIYLFSFSHFHMIIACLTCFCIQEAESMGTVVFIHDLSINGTFVNGTKIGKCNS